LDDLRLLTEFKTINGLDRGRVDSNWMHTCPKFQTSDNRAPIAIGTNLRSLAIEYETGELPIVPKTKKPQILRLAAFDLISREQAPTWSICFMDCNPRLSNKAIASLRKCRNKIAF
jgi:hypothetical protein